MTVPPAVLHVVPCASRLGGYERQAWNLACETVRRRSDRNHASPITFATSSSDAKAIVARGHDDPLRPAVEGCTGAGTRLSQRATALTSAHNVLHFHGLDGFSAPFAAAALQRGTPFVVKIATQGDVSAWSGNGDSLIRERLEERPEASTAERMLKRTYWRMKMRGTWKSMQRASAFIALNDAIRTELIDAGVTSSRIHVWPNMVHIPRAAPTPGSSLHAITVARIEPRKRVGVVLEACERVRRSHPDVRLTVVGDGPERASLQEGSGPGVQWAGAVPVDAAMLAQYGLFVFASNREGCPNALLEAAATGMACVATDIPGIREWFETERHALLVPTDDAAAVATAWGRIIETTGLGASLGASAREQMSRIASPDVLVPRYEDLYATLAGA